MWIQLWIIGFVTLVIFIALPETSHPYLLLQRAKRLRKLTGNPNFKSQGELDMVTPFPSVLNLLIGSNF